jgi:2-haloacid dehalogenase
MPSPLTGIRACVFDAYGTLFDVAAAAAACRDVLGERAGPLAALWREKQLQYSWLRGLAGSYADFWQLTQDSLDFSLETMDIAPAGVRERLLGLYRSLAAFPEVPEVLRSLRAAGFRTAILSNGSPAMLASAVEGNGLAGLLDAVISVDEVGVFKPHPSVYQRALDRLEVPAGAVSFQSSNAWDAHAASAFGMRVVWCNRYGQRRERLPGAPDREIRTLSELPALLAP